MRRKPTCLLTSSASPGAARVGECRRIGTEPVRSGVGACSPALNSTPKQRHAPPARCWSEIAVMLTGRRPSCFAGLACFARLQRVRSGPFRRAGSCVPSPQRPIKSPINYIPGRPLCFVLTRQEENICLAPNHNIQVHQDH